jgi:hypothetical protein
VNPQALNTLRIRDVNLDREDIIGRGGEYHGTPAR